MSQELGTIVREPSRVSRWWQALRHSWLFDPPRLSEPAVAKARWRLRLLAFAFGFFGICGLLVMGLATVLDGPPRDIHVNDEPRSLLSVVITFLGMLVTAWGLNRRSRSAALGAVALFLIPAIEQLLRGTPVAFDLFGVAAVVIIASVWRDLE